MFSTASKRTSLFAAAACSALAVAAAFSTPAAARRSDDQPAAVASIAQEPIGPKKSVAVIDFGANGAFLAYYGDWNAGGGLAAMLESELTQSDLFRVANRSRLDAALYEQQLSASGLTAAPTAWVGGLVGAQYLIEGTVTDFTLAEKGGGVSLGGTVGGVLGGISPQSRTGNVSIDFRVMDSTSNEVVASFTVTKKVRSRSVALSASKSGYKIGANSFENTPLGDAAREAMQEAAWLIADSLKDKSWAAHVAQVRADTLYVNAGAESGLRTGDTLHIYRIVDQIVDPMTGATLGVEKAEIGRAVVSSVADKYSRADYSATLTPEPGDVLTFESRQFDQPGGEPGAR
jgi:curli biogenesis system outer membrane secretion channel CsgG